MSPAKPATAKPAALPVSDVTPEMAMSAIERQLTELGVFGGGQRRQALLVAGQRLHKALGEVQAIEARAKELRDGMAQLVKEAIDAVNGTTPPKPPKARTSATGVPVVAPGATPAVQVVK